MSVVRVWAVVAVLALGAAAAGAFAATFPERPIRLIIGSAPGSGPDIVARLLADHLHGAWGQQVVVDSRPGVAGIISVEQTLRANPDGYTWLMMTSQLFIATAVFPNLKFDLDKDFVSIALIGSVPYILLVNPKVPAKSVPDLIALAKKSPGKLRYGSAGTAGGEHFTMLMFAQAAGIDMLHVPYKGIAQALIDVVADEIQLAFAVYPAGKPHVDTGRLRALGVTMSKRAAGLPDVPAIGEFVPGYSTFGWYSIVALKGTPEAVLRKASAEVVNGIRAPTFGERLKTQGIEITPGERKELDAFRAAERKRFTDLIKTTGVSLQ